MVNTKYRKDPCTKDEDLAAMKDWLRKQPHLPDEWEDSCLLTFLRGCSFSLEKCKRKLDLYFTMRAACPELSCNRDILRPEMLDVMTRSYQCPLPDFTPNGWRISVTKGLDRTLEMEHLLQVVKIIMMEGDIRIREANDLEASGDVIIMDAGIIQARHLMTLSPVLLKKIFVCIEAYPVKLKEIHVVNTTPIVDSVYSMLKPLLTDKIKKRVYFHKDYTSLYRYIPKDILPKDYGGTGPSLDEVNKYWLEKLKEYRGWFKEQELLKANEALRPGKPKNYADIFGMEGSFRQLTID